MPFKPDAFLRPLVAALALGCAAATLPALAADSPAAEPTQPAPNMTADALARYRNPLTPGKPIAAPRVQLDTSEAPDLKPWAEQARQLVEEWHPILCRFLATEEYKPPRVLTLKFKPRIDNPAFASGNAITFSATWIRQHPDDFGMVIHELVHIIQQYPGVPTTPGWLVEGIADYMRFWKYEPEYARPVVNPQTARYTDAYRTTGAFLAWVSNQYNKALVPALDRAMRHKEDPIPVFKRLTGQDVDALWAEFIASLKK